MFFKSIMLLVSLAIVLTPSQVSVVEAGPIAYTACLAACFAAISPTVVVGGIVLGTACYAVCAPALAAPTP
jgi:hypothetical protein